MIEKLQIPYDDFKLHEIIDPEQFDLNNSFIVNKINELRNVLNQITDSIEDGGSGADIISLTPIEGFASDKLQSFLEEVLVQLRSTQDGQSGADVIGATRINGISGETVQAQLESLKAFIDGIRNNLSTNHTHDNRYMTRSELAPYLQGGDTVAHEETFTIVSSNNGDGTFTYHDAFGNTFTGELDEVGQQIFTLTHTYKPGVNHLEAFIDDHLRRSARSGGLEEIDAKHIKLSEVLAVGQELTVKYFERVGVTGEHSIVMGKVKPPPTDGQIMWFKVVD